jgi:hypothetical protein
MSAPSRLDFVDVVLELQRQIKYFNCFNLENTNDHLLGTDFLLLLRREAANQRKVQGQVLKVERKVAGSKCFGRK